jgi:hypothetical protein
MSVLVVALLLIAALVAGLSVALVNPGVPRRLAGRRLRQTCLCPSYHAARSLPPMPVALEGDVNRHQRSPLCRGYDVPPERP